MTHSKMPQWNKIKNTNRIIESKIGEEPLRSSSPAINPHQIISDCVEIVQTLRELLRFSFKSKSFQTTET